MTLINKDSHEVEWRNGETENWYAQDPSWVVVPSELEVAAKASGGCCELTFDDEGALIALTPTPKPDLPEPEPSPEERLRADVDYLAALQGVTL